MSEPRLPRSLLLAYGLPGLSLAVLGLPAIVYLPSYYGDELGISLALVGLVLLVARLWDVVTDPLVGWLSDRFGTPLGWRRPWILIGAPLLLLGVWKLFIPADGVGAGYLLGWALVGYLGWTLVSLPYNAWGAEISPDYHQRARITGSREGFIIAGTVLAVMVPALVQLAGGDRAAALAAVFWLLLLMLPLSMLLLMWRVPETARRHVPLPWRESISLLAGNRPFRRLMLAYFLNGLANGLPATLFLYFVTAVIVGGGGEEAQRASGLLLLVYFAAGIAGLPLGVALSRRLGKHRAWCWAMLWTCTFFVWVPLLGQGDLGWFLLICVLTGLTLGVDTALPAAMQADVIDEDTVASGSSRAGLYFALWSMATKLALALAAGIAYPLLAVVGFEPAGENTAAALFVLAALYGLLPVLIKLVAVGLMWNFPLDRARQQSLRRQIDRRAVT